MGRIITREQFGRQMSNMREFLHTKGYFVAADALQYGREMHTGTRKDGVSPEFSHQVFLANYARVLLPHLMYPEETLAALFLHDVPEDFGVPFEAVRERFGENVERPVRLMTKKHQGVVIPYDVYFRRLAECPVGSIGKGLDRGHNLLTMESAGWGLNKQEGYVDDVDQRFLEMLKTARERFGRQKEAYHHIKTMLVLQSAHIRTFIAQGRELEAAQARIGELESLFDDELSPTA